MDSVHFDTLVKALAQPGTRRSLLRVLAAVPMATGLLTLREPDEVQGRGRRRGKPGQDGKDGTSRDGKRGNGGSRTRCRAESRAKTCKGRCGKVKNICGKRVNCGPCTCKAERACCGEAGFWCQDGSCRAIPNDARATLEECGGRCDCVPDAENACGGGSPASATICGTTRNCPLCSDCAVDPNNCSQVSVGDGPEGGGFYCVASGSPGSCMGTNSHTDCPQPDSQVCGAGSCRDICYGTGG